MHSMKYCLWLAIASGVAFGADPTLLQLVPPDAGAIAGLQVDQGKKSPLGQYVLAHIREPQAGLGKLLSESGFDPRRDISEVVLALSEPMISTPAASTPAASTPAASTPAAPQSRELVLARGTFDPARAESVVTARGGLVTNFQGVHLLAGDTNGTQVLAFLDTTTAVLGDIGLVEEAIARHASGVAAGSWSAQAQTLSAANDFWFLTNGPISALTSAMPDGQFGGAMQSGQMFQSVTEASGGLKFGVNVVFTADAVTRSEKDAQALAGLLRFLAGMIQTNKSNNPAASQLSSLLSSLVLSTTANVTHLSLTVPEAQLESFL
ncbi:MAG: hypothetical protein ACRD5L_00615, partial [Bryobacteraceae bacterium]